MFKAGQVLWGIYPIGIRKDRPMIVLIDEQIGQKVAVACTSTDITGILADTTTVLKAGAHQEIRADSCVVYEESALVEGEALRTAITAGKYQFDPGQVLVAADLSNVQQGIHKSDLTPIEIQDFAIKRGIV